MKERKELKKVLFIFLFLAGITLITAGVTYAFYSYSKSGSTESTIRSGKVTLHYDEGGMQGISLSDALPMSDEQGKVQTQYFEFRITSDTTSFEIPYIITARKQGDVATRIPDENIKIYLTEVNGSIETEKALFKYSELTNIQKNSHIEQEVFRTNVPVNTSNYEKIYRLRMWLDESTSFSPVEVGGVQTYPLNNKSFQIRINVYTEVEAAPQVCTAVFTNETGGPLAQGSEVSIGSEHFYVIDTNEQTTTLLAKYNIVPLGYATSSSGPVEGLQFQDDWYAYGQVPFSKTNYWSGSTNLDNIYDETKNVQPVFLTNNCDPSNPNYDQYMACSIVSIDNTQTSDDYSVAYYVENYADTIERMGATINDSRLLLKTEAEELDNTSISGLTASTAGFWLGTALDDDYVYAYFGWGITGLPYNESNSLNHSGIRPVLEVPTCTIAVD